MTRGDWSGPGSQRAPEGVQQQGEGQGEIVREDWVVLDDASERD